MSSSPSLRKALAYLHTLIRERSQDDDPFLPTIASMASSAGVSLVTMWKAVGVLRQQGVLAGSRGHATEIVRASESPSSPEQGAPDMLCSPAPAASHGACQRVRSRLESDILSGAFAGGNRLPSQKELTHKYGTSYRTVRTALENLSDDRILLRQGRGFSLRGQDRHGGGSRIVALGLAGPDGRLLMGDLDLATLHALGVACTRAGIELDIRGFTVTEGAVTYRDMQGGNTVALRALPALLGYFLLAIHPDGAPEALLRQLLSHNLPVAVLDELGEYAWPSWFCRGARVRIFTMTASTTPGRQVARYSLAAHHRGVAFISPFHYYRYSRQRWQGIDEVYRAAGGEAHAQAFVRTDLSLPNFEQRARDRVDTRPIRESYSSWRSDLPSAYAHLIDQRIDELGAMSLYQAEIHACCHQLFEEALRDQGVTAWLLANDFVAACAMDFLTARGIRIPQMIALVGFDDTLDAFRRGISSYNFNTAAVAAAMLGYITNPHSLGVFRGDSVIEVEGMIVRRRTC